MTRLNEEFGLYAPCECGASDAVWHGDRHGDRHGLRRYMCARCWEEETDVTADTTCNQTNKETQT